jgi:hypothetical protein
MPISVACNQCGKRLKVPDDWMGKKAKCPGCSATFIVGADGAEAASAAPAFAPAAQKKKIQTPRMEIPGWMIGAVVVVVLIGGIIAAAYFGPVRTKAKWEAVQPQAETDITDVAQRGMESFLSQNGMDLSKPNALPQVREVTFAVLPIMFSMPKTVAFKAVTNQGEFNGNYEIATGEVEGDCEIGGVGFSGMTTAYKHGGISIHLTGRRKSGQLSVEVNGKDAVVVYPKKEDK